MKAFLYPDSGHPERLSVGRIEVDPDDRLVVSALRHATAAAEAYKLANPSLPDYLEPEAVRARYRLREHTDDKLRAYYFVTTDTERSRDVAIIGPFAEMAYAGVMYGLGQIAGGNEARLAELMATIQYVQPQPAQV